jgi:hypothetical protein
MVEKTEKHVEPPIDLHRPAPSDLRFSARAVGRSHISGESANKLLQMAAACAQHSAYSPPAGPHSLDSTVARLFCATPGSRPRILLRGVHSRNDPRMQTRYRPYPDGYTDAATSAGNLVVNR